jgi:hypothetical protein
LESRNHLS